MTEQKPVSGADLIAGIVKGQVPRQVRLFAAQGLLPISREELLGLQCVLSSDPNEELAKVAADSVRGAELVIYSSAIKPGNPAFDAAVATGFTLQIVEPHLNGPGGEVPVICQAAGEDRPRVLCGQGIAPAATVLLARWGFQELRLRRIEIIVATGNVRSQRVAEKAGAQREGVLRQRIKINDRMHDAAMYSLVPGDI